MWEIAAIVEVLERRGPCTNKTSTTSSPSSAVRIPMPSILETAFPEPYLLTETENKIIDDILELLN
jgi:hypothetical protein